MIQPNEIGALSIKEQIHYIDLPSGEVATVSIEDKELADSYTWHAIRDKNRRCPITVGASIMGDNDRPTIRMLHRLIMTPPKNMFVIHLDDDGLNNARSNLLVIDRRVTSLGQRRKLKPEAGYRGVWCDRIVKTPRWQAGMKENHRHTGQYYHSPLIASLARDIMVITSAPDEMPRMVDALNHPDLLPKYREWILSADYVLDGMELANYFEADIKDLTDVECKESFEG